jgi:hypothetical protein
MKTQRYILTALCLGVCVWAAAMIMGVLGLVRAQGSFEWMSWLEITAFSGAGLLPLVLIRKADPGWRRTALVAACALCLTYVTLLALNLLRLGFFTKASLRLALWTAIAVLLVRTLRLPQNHVSS